MADYIDSDTAILALTPSAVDEKHSVDQATVTLRLTAETTYEEHTTYDADQAYLVLTAAGEDTYHKFFAQLTPVKFFKRWEANPLTARLTVPYLMQQHLTVSYFGKAYE